MSRFLVLLVIVASTAGAAGVLGRIVVEGGQSKLSAVSNLTTKKPFAIPPKGKVLVRPDRDARVCVQRFRPGGVPICDPRWVPMVDAGASAVFECGPPFFTPLLPDGGSHPVGLSDTCVVSCVPEAWAYVTCEIEGL
jgi:hypothetical protein